MYRKMIEINFCKEINGSPNGSFWRDILGLLVLKVEIRCLILILIFDKSDFLLKRNHGNILTQLERQKRCFARATKYKFRSRCENTQFF